VEAEHTGARGGKPRPASTPKSVSAIRAHFTSGADVIGVTASGWFVDDDAPDLERGCDTTFVNDEDTGAERHINIHLSPEIMGGVYANFANVSHSDYEFTVTFARVDHEVESDEVPGVVVSRINLSPRFMRELIDAMEDNYSKWRTREGIKNLPEYGGAEAQGPDEE
jgi:hypothetical protein